MPRYVEIASALEQQIENMSPNSLLPTEQQLAKHFSVSRVTIRRALGLLDRSGRVTRLRGRGTIVNPPKIVRHMVPVCSLEHDLSDQGLKLENQAIEFHKNITLPPFIRCRLPASHLQSACVLRLVRSVDDRIICYDERYLLPPIADHFRPEMIRDRPLLDVLQQLAGAPISKVDWELEIIPAPPDTASVLKILPGMLIVVSRFTDYLPNGAPVDTGVVSYRIDRVKFGFAASGPIVALA